MIIAVAIVTGSFPELVIVHDTMSFLVLYSSLRGFQTSLPGTPIFSSPQKTNINT